MNKLLTNEKGVDKYKKPCYNTDIRKRKNKGEKTMRFIGYFVNGKNYGCSKSAREKAEKDAKEKNTKVELKPYKI
jgi:hypothetical protein